MRRLAANLGERSASCRLSAFEGRGAKKARRNCLAFKSRLEVISFNQADLG